MAAAAAPPSGVTEPLRGPSPATAAAFELEERVFVHGLTSERGRAFNLRAARVTELSRSSGERVGIRLLGEAGGAQASAPDGKRPRRTGSGGAAGALAGAGLSVKPGNLLRARVPEDRRRVLLAQVVERCPQIAVVRKFLDQRLPAGPGSTSCGDSNGAPVYTQETSPLLFRIAEFVAAPRNFPHQFSGYMGKLWWEHWRYDEAARPVQLVPRMAAAVAADGPATDAAEPIVRLDCAVAVLDDKDFPGIAIFAGGCGAHPAQCRHPEGFYKSAVMYDSLLDEWFPLPDMPTRRHGPAAACVGRRVYVLGGQYAHDPSEDDGVRHVEGPRFCDVLDFDTRSWRCQEVGPMPKFRDIHVADVMERAAFFAAGAVGGRVVACLQVDRRSLQVLTVAFNPAREADGWRAVECPDASDQQVAVAASSCATEYRGELVVASGRPPPLAHRAAAFRFVGSAADPEFWHHGSWRQLPDLAHARVGGALVVVEGRLYITGGVDEISGQFLADAERLDEPPGEPARWTLVPWFRMPRALHAHDCVALPTLARRQVSVEGESKAGQDGL